MNGNDEELTIYTFNSGKAGESLLILSAIHGNETAGTKASLRIMREIKEGAITLQKGSVTFVPVCNPRANANDCRYNEENLNRILRTYQSPKTYEQKLANQIVILLQKYKYILDLHGTYNDKEPAFCFLDYPNVPEYRTILKAVPVNFVLTGWPQIYENAENKAISTDKYARDVGNFCMTVECGYLKAEEATEVAYKTILNTMAQLKIIVAKPDKLPAKTFIRLKNFRLKQRAGKLLEPFKHLDFISVGTPIAAYDDGEIITTPYDMYIIIPNHSAKIGEEWFYTGVKESAPQN